MEEIFLIDLVIYFLITEVIGVWTILIPIIFGVVCMRMNKRKGYSSLVGFFYGACCSVVGLLMVKFRKPKDESEKIDKLTMAIEGFTILIGIQTAVVFIYIFVDEIGCIG